MAFVASPKAGWPMAKQEQWPTKIRIKSRWWRIEYHDSIRDEEDEGELLGYCRADKRLIVISRDQSPGSMRDTLVHEIFHAVYSTMPRTTSEDAEEVEEAWVLGATEGFFEVVNNSDTAWFLGDDWE